MVLRAPTFRSTVKGSECTLLTAEKKIKGINNSRGNDDIIHEDLKVGDEL